VVLTMPKFHLISTFAAHVPAHWRWCVWVLGLALCQPALTQTVADTSPLSGVVNAWLQSQTQAKADTWPADKAAAPPRIEVLLGELNPRLKLAPCQKVAAYIPQGQKLWGRTRVGLRCEQGAVRWNVFWPVTVKVWGSGLVLAAAIEPGQQLGPQDIKVAEVDLAESTSPPVLDLSEALGRLAQRRLPEGHSLRQSDLKARRWFSAGDPVRLHVKGAGFMAASEGTALGHGDEGRCARIRTSQGRVLCAYPKGNGLAEITL
jgi:flagella basal body P-ring formation protein FlgA